MKTSSLLIGNPKKSQSMCSKRSRKELPPEIMQAIFDKLPILYLPTCRLVCRAWNDLVLDHASTSKVVTNTFFMCKKTEMHMQQPYSIQCIDFDKKEDPSMISYFVSFTFDHGWSNVGISNSCNGLLCIFEGQEWGTKPRAAILNPMTNEHICLPQDHILDSSKISYFYGFGFNPETKQYKIGRVSFDMKRYSSVVEIYTFGINEKWRSIDSTSFVIRSHGVYFNGGIYWFGSERSDVICRLDVETEKFKTISVPGVGPYLNSSIGVLNDCLYATFRNCHCFGIEVWMMQSSHGGGGEESWVQESWVPRDLSPQHHRVRGEQLHLIKIFEDGEVLGIFNKLYLFSYHPKTRRIKTFNNNIDGILLWVHQIHSFTFDSLQRILTPKDDFCRVTGRKKICNQSLIKIKYGTPS